MFFSGTGFDFYPGIGGLRRRGDNDDHDNHGTYDNGNDDATPDDITIDDDTSNHDQPTRAYNYGTYVNRDTAAYATTGDDTSNDGTDDASRAGGNGYYLGGI
jgi:hypothetical protein